MRWLCRNIVINGVLGFWGFGYSQPETLIGFGQEVFYLFHNAGEIQVLNVEVLLSHNWQLPFAKGLPGGMG